MHYVEFKAAIQQVLPAFFACCICCLLPGCSYDSTPSAPAPYYGPAWKPQYKLGVRSAREEIEHGVLAWETHANGEWEEYRIRWCLRKILAEKYGIEYRIRGHFGTGDYDARIRGYQSAMDPLLSSKLGADWKERIHEEAKTFYHAHWHEVERQFFIDEREQPGYEDYVRQHPISEQEQQTRNPLDRFYDYRDN